MLDNPSKFVHDKLKQLEGIGYKTHPVVRIFFIAQNDKNKNNIKNFRLNKFFKIFLFKQIKGTNRENIKNVLFKNAKIEKKAII